MRYKKRLIFVIGLTLLLLACGIPGLEDGYLNLDIEFSESEFEETMQNGNLTINNENVFEEITAVDFQEGIVHMEGIRNGEEAFIDISFASEEGQLVVEVVDHNVADLGSDLDQLNEALANSISAGTDQSGEVEFTNVEVTDDTFILEMRVRVSE